MHLFNLIPLLSTATLAVAGVIQPSSVLEARQSSYSCKGKSYADTMLYSFNIHRSNHSAPNLTWNSTLAALAANLARNGDIGVHDPW